MFSLMLLISESFGIFFYTYKHLCDFKILKHQFVGAFNVGSAKCIKKITTCGADI